MTAHAVPRLIGFAAAAALAASAALALTTHHASAEVGTSMPGSAWADAQGEVRPLGGTPAQDCVRSQGYWSQHPQRWPVSSLVLGNATRPGHTYSHQELLTLLRVPVRGDASLILARQLIAARLNVAAGARPDPIAAQLTLADQLLSAFTGRLPYRLGSNTPIGAQMVHEAQVLERYNTGQIPGSCGPTNRAPVANAGPDQTIAVGATVTLTGAGSTDPDGDALTYQWTLVSVPQGSTAVLSGSHVVSPSFVADRPGRYEVRLVVRDATLSSAPDTVVVSTLNSAPRADAGPDRHVAVGALVTLSGAGSNDPDGDALQYAWRLVSTPDGSLAQLAQNTAVQSTFTPDLPGTYIAELVVFDGALPSDPDTVAISTVNSPPVARAGADGTGVVGERIVLDGSASSDVDGDALTFRWALLSQPVGSAAALESTATATTALTLDTFGEYVVQLIVHDGTVDSDPDTVVLTTRNTPPVADAGPNQTVNAGAVVTLDGSGSTDVDGQPLTWMWALLSVPDGSLAVLSDAQAVQPTFTADQPGTYVAQLIVNDGLVDSTPATVRITSEAEPVNRPPVADAGPDQTVTLGSTVTLDGTSSSDADGDALTYHWSLSRPATSAAVLDDATAMRPTFVADVPGTYVAQLIVNDGTVDSAPDTTSVSTDNVAPVANAGPDQIVTAGAVVTLDGSASTDLDGQALTYTWALTGVPVGSGATLSDPAAVRPTFTADLPGTYVAQLIVNDGVVDSAPATVTITSEPPPNQPPTANAGPDQTVAVGATVTLDGSASTDPEGAGLTYQWSLTRPAASSAELSNPASVSPTFTADAAGTYVAQLIVNDGEADSEPDTVTISTANSRPVANAGPDRNKYRNGTVQLDGRASYDPDGTTLTYAWSILSNGTAGTASLDNPTSPTPGLYTFATGTVVVQLIVSDGVLSSEPDTIVITAMEGIDLRPRVWSTSTLATGVRGGIQFIVENLGQGVASEVQVRLTMPSAYVVHSVTGSGTYDPGTGIFTIPNFSSYAFVNLDVTPLLTGSYEFVVDAQLVGQADIHPPDNVLRINLVPTDGADLQLSQPANPSGTHAPGARLAFSSRLSNLGPTHARNVRASIPIPAGYTVAQVYNGGTFNPTARAVEWSLSTLQYGSYVDLTIEIVVNPTGPTNLSVTVAADNPDPNVADNHRVLGPINRPPALGVIANRTVPNHVPVSIDGSATDPEGNPLSYLWIFLQRPFGSAATIATATSAVVTLTPDRPGLYLLRVTVSDGGGSVSTTVSLTVQDVHHPPVIRSTPPTLGAVSQPYRYDVRATDPDVGDVLSYSLSAPPQGMTIDAISGAIAWTPVDGQGGPQTVTVAVHDAIGLSDSQSFAIQVSSASNQAPVAADDAYTVRLGESLGVGTPGVLSNDTDASPLRAVLKTPPANGALLLNPDGSFTYTPHAQRNGAPLVTGEINLAHRLPGVAISGGQDPAATADDDPSTTNGPFYGNAGEVLEIALPVDATVNAIELLRSVFVTAAPPRGTVRLLDAQGTVLYDSGLIQMEPTVGLEDRFEFPQPVETVRRVRFTMVDGAFGEFRVMGTVTAFRSSRVEADLLQRLAVTVQASSGTPEAALDDVTSSNWVMTTANPSEFIEIRLPMDVTATAIRGGSRSNIGVHSSLGIHCYGAFQLRSAGGTVLFDSGTRDIPTSPNLQGGYYAFDIPVPAIAGVRVLRYQLGGCYADNRFEPGFSEFELIGTPSVDVPAFNIGRSMQSLIHSEVHSTPIVVNLTDDNADGRIDTQDIPDIAVPVEADGYQLAGPIKVVSGDNGRELFTTGAPDLVSPWSEIAAGDLDGDELPELVAVHADANHLVAFEHTGAQKWISDAAPMPTFQDGTFVTGAVSLANLDASGPPEIIVGATVFDANGRLLGRGQALGGTIGGAGMRSALSAVADIDLDGVPELVAGPTAYRLVNGQLSIAWQRTDRADGYTALGNFDDDPHAEVVVVANGFVYMLNHDGTDAEVWNPPSHAPIRLPGNGMGGAPLVADVDGDGRPEIGVASDVSYVVLNHTGGERWRSSISDRSSNSTGSVAFDLDGDGAVEIIYRDEHYLRIYRGSDGAVLVRRPVVSATWTETPTVADVDNDGHADIVVTSDQYFDNYGDTGVIVFNDWANLWTRTRRIWNQHAYHVTNVNEDASIPVAESPHWLLPGLNGFRTNRFMPGESADAADQFTYAATDGVLESNVATVRIAVRPVNDAPNIVSTPAVMAARGVVYVYAARATDPDAGDILAYSLTTAPVGMSIDAASGVVRWTPEAGQLGVQQVVVKATDLRGLFALQSYAVTVGAPVAVPDVVGQLRTAAEGVVAAAMLAVGAGSARHSPTVATGVVISQTPVGGTLVAAGTAVGLTVSLGPAPSGTVPDLVGLTQTAATADLVAAQFVLGTVTPFYTATVPTGVVLSQTPAAGTIADLGTAIALGVSAGPPPGTLDVDGDGYTGDQGDCNDTNAAINPGAFDVPGDGIDQNCNGVDSVPGDGTAPTAVLVTPADLAEVTMPTDVTGTVSDANFLRYTLQMAGVDEMVYRTIGSGTSPVTSGVVGRIDPTLLENGLYRVRLIAEDVNGQTAVDERVYRVDGTAKVGHFRLSFTDLSVPVAGVPISVVRTYDSRVQAQRDFGIGWTLELKTGTYRHNRAPGEGWIIRDQPYLGGVLPCIGGSQETRTHLTEVRLSDRESYRFALEVTNGNLGITGACEGTASFRFLEGRRPGATLQILGSTSVIYLRGGDDVVLDMDAFLEGTHVPYNPARVRLTLPEGTQIDLERVAGVTRIADLNGNELTLTSQGLVHSSGRSIRFDRDAAQRITRITDPRGQALTYGYDGAGDLATFTDQAGHATTFRYDSTHRLLEIRDALGRASQNEYDADGRLVAIVDATGNRTVFAHDLDARVETLTDRLGHTTTLEYDLRGNVVRRVDPLGGVSTFTYDARDNRLTETDPLGHTLAYTYDGRDNVLSRTDPLGHTTSHTYSATNQVLTTTDPSGGVTTVGYDSRDNVVAEVDATGARTTHTYDASGNRTSTTDAAGGRWTFAYDAAGQVIQSVTPVGQTRQTSRDPNGNALLETRPLGSGASTELATTQFVYDGLNRRTRIVNAGGAVHDATYTPTGLVATQTNAAGGVTTYAYDAQDRLVRTLHPDGTAETAAYDGEGRRTATTDRAGRTTTFAYDALGRLVTTTHPDGTTMTATYDAAGRQIRSTDALGRTTVYGYDAAGHQTSVRDPLGNVTAMAYDEAGHLMSTTDGNGHTTTFAYDAEGRRTGTVFPDGTSIADAYDALGRRVSRTDPAGNVSHFEYDNRGALTRVIDPLGHATTYAYNDLDKRVTQTDALGQTTRFAYDRLGRLVRTTLPLGQTDTRTYDVAGRLLSRRDFNGAVTSYTYDTMFRLASRTLPDGETHTFAYTPTGLLGSMTDPTGTTTFEYDLRDRPTRVGQPDGTEIRYAYDAAGNRTAVTTAGGTVGYAYDLANRLTQITDLEGRQSALAYDAAGNLATLTYPNGVEAQYQFDTRNRLTHLTQVRGAETLRSYQYTIGPAGNRTQVVEDTGRTVDYTYDALFRLTGETVSVPGQATTSLSYAYDAVGNRISQTGTAGTVTYAYDANSRLTQSGGQTFAYDGNGNQLTAQGVAGLTTYVYDGLNRLVQATRAGATTGYAYNALDHRVQSTGPSGPTTYLIDPFGAENLTQILRESSSSGAVDYVHGHGMLVSMRRPTGTSFYLPDGRASTRLLADAAGAITDRYEYDPFGNVAARQGSTPNEFLFAGQRLDSALGLYDLRARHYDPRAGRFTSRDPFPGVALDPGSLHPYTYAHNDPVNRSDPSGQFTLAETMAVSAGVGVLAGTAYAAHSYYYYRSAELAFEIGVDAAFTYASLTMDLVGLGGLIRPVAREIIQAVAQVTARRTLINQTGANVGKTLAQQTDDVATKVLCRLNPRCGLKVEPLQKAAAEIAEREAARKAQVEAALEAAKKKGVEAAAKQVPTGAGALTAKEAQRVATDAAKSATDEFIDVWSKLDKK